MSSVPRNNNRHHGFRDELRRKVVLHLSVGLGTSWHVLALPKTAVRRSESAGVHSHTTQCRCFLRYNENGETAHGYISLFLLLSVSMFFLILPGAEALCDAFDARAECGRVSVALRCKGLGFQKSTKWRESGCGMHDLVVWGSREWFDKMPGNAVRHVAVDW